MSGDEKPAPSPIGQTRFLVVDSDPRILEGMRRFLTAENALRVHVAQSVIVALRILQDRNTPVDCIICAHRPETISGVDFLLGLRTGRWGGLSLKHMKFIIMLPALDNQALVLAEHARATGYIIGGLDRNNVRQSILTALDPRGPDKPAPNFNVAPLRASEADLIIALFPVAFSHWPIERQSRAMRAVATAALAENINGAIAAVYPTEDGGTAFIAPQPFHRFMSKLTVAFCEKLPTRAIHVTWPDGDPAAMPKMVEAPSEPAAPLPLFEEESTEEAADRRRDIPPQRERDFARGLTDDDIRNVALAFKEMGPQEFMQRFVRHQAISLQGQSLTPMMREFYVSIEQLRATFFPGVEMRGSNKAFQNLTHMLDQLMLRSLPHLPLGGLPCSINLNIHSILSKSFETMLQNTQGDLLTFEIPQPSIIPHFAQFKKARDLIVAHGGKIAVDQIFPDTIGALNLDEAGVNFAKLHWKGDLKKLTRKHRDFVKKTIDNGTTMVMSRVDDPVAFEVGQEFGIRNFQGFLIDHIANRK